LDFGGWGKEAARRSDSAQLGFAYCYGTMGKNHGYNLGAGFSVFQAKQGKCECDFEKLQS
jgi:hypothetical protein